LTHDVPLAGSHQRQNAALAVAAARAMVPTLCDAAIENGLRRLRWAGRFERIGQNVILDGAHNGASAEALAQTLRAQTHGPLTFVLAINRDKDARGVIKPLLPLAECIIATQTRDNLRALPAEELGSLCRRLGAPTLVEASLEAALARATGRLVCVTGSLLLVGQVRTLLGVPPPERLW
jgi:dihydrofolate synthase/folylpolyglutamate synthase